jgi:PEP-CTERM putative exosortase interaction domain
MPKPSSSLMVLSAMLLSMGTVQPGYGMSFGKHNNGGGPANQSSTEGNGNEHGRTAYGGSLDSQPYPVPVPEPASVVLMASGLLGLGLGRWKRQSVTR